jgi:hypothetical protein
MLLRKYIKEEIEPVVVVVVGGRVDNAPKCKETKGKRVVRGLENRTRRETRGRTTEQAARFEHGISKVLTMRSTPRVGKARLCVWSAAKTAYRAVNDGTGFLQGG